MNNITKQIFTQEIYPYVTCAQYEIIHAYTNTNTTFFVFLPHNALSKMGKRPRIGQSKVEIFTKHENLYMNETLHRILIGRIGRGKLYLYSGGAIRELTDDVFSKNKAKHIIRIALGIKEIKEIDQDREDLNAYIANVRERDERERTYIHDARPIRRHKCSNHTLVDCAGYHYSSLGNYVTSVKAGSTTRVTVKKSY